MSSVDLIVKLFESPQDIQLVSNFAHQIWGISLVIAALLYTAYVWSGRRRKFLRIICIDLLFSSMIFVAYLFFVKGLENVVSMGQIIFSYPELYIHIVMTTIVVVGVVLELRNISGRSRHPLLPLALPILSLVGIGFLFIVHPRDGIHDENTMFVHSIIGCGLILAGTMITIERLLQNRKYKSLISLIAVASLVVSGLLLIQFNEPNSAYQAYYLRNIEIASNVVSNNDVTVYITKDGVVPQRIQIKAGGMITFYQADNSWHDISSGPHPTHIDYPPLNIGYLSMDESRSVELSAVGVYGFHDHINDIDERFQGIIEVVE